MTMLVVTHEMGFARSVADWVVVMENAKCWRRAHPHASSADRVSLARASFFSGSSTCPTIRRRSYDERRGGLTMSNVLITGGGGFIGLALAE
jgi:energy-coupling factor transporter ATP-binding protein EcfA2